MMTALGTGLSPQACRQARIKRLSSRRHRPSRVQRANSVYSVPNGMSQSWPMARHCRPQNATHQIAMIALRSAAPVNGGFGPERVDRGHPRHGRELRQHRVNEGTVLRERTDGLSDLEVLTIGGRLVDRDLTVALRPFAHHPASTGSGSGRQRGRRRRRRPDPRSRSPCPSRRPVAPSPRSTPGRGARPGGPRPRAARRRRTRALAGWCSRPYWSPPRS